MNLFSKLAVITLVIMGLFGLSMNFSQVFAQEDDLATLRQKREELERRVDEIQNQLQGVQSEKKSLQREVNRLNLEIKKTNLEIEKLGFTIKEMNIAIREKEAKIKEIENKISVQKDFLKEAIRQINDYDQISLIEVILGYDDLSGFFNSEKTVQDVEKSLLSSLASVKRLKTNLSEEVEALENELADQYRLKQIQEIEAAGLAGKKSERDAAIKNKQYEESILRERLAETRDALSSIQQYFSALVLEGVRVNTEDIISFAKEASLKTGVRTAFLLAVLETESKMGQNVGRGTWREDMPESQKEAFSDIISRLDLHPDDVPVSKKVVSSSGRLIMWGGAMGPAQFMPKTWLGYEAEVAALTDSNPPNPWDMGDALHAMALYLEKRGASDSSRELSAARAYISGDPNCYKQVCNSYAYQIQEKTIRWQEYLNNL